MTMTFTPSAAPPAATSTRATATSTPTAPRAHRGTSINLFLAAIVAVGIIAGLVGWGGGAAANSPIEPVSAVSVLDDAIEVYVVQPGDTLWAIASQIARPGEDIRPIVDALKERSGGSSLDIGQRIIIDHSTIRG